MIDFDKLRQRMREPAVHVTYRCERCGATHEYVCPMPEHLRVCDDSLSGRRYPSCGGTLVEVSRREVPT